MPYFPETSVIKGLVRVVRERHLPSGAVLRVNHAIEGGQVDAVNVLMEADILGAYRILDVATQFKLSSEDLSSKSRKKAFTFPRQVSMYFSRKYTEKGLGEIGKAFNRDHSTVVHSIRVITEAMNQQNSVRGQIELLDKKINDRFLSC